MALDRSVFQVEESIELASSIVRGTKFAKELAKWDKPKSQGGYRCDGFEEFPKMLYKAQKVNGKNVCLDVEPLPDQFPTDDQWRRATESITRRNRENTCIVGSPEEEERRKRDGWRNTPQDAVGFLNGLDDDVAKAAAHRAYEDRNMSEPAKREIAAAEEAADGAHVAEVVAKPRRGRPRKAVA